MRKNIAQKLATTFLVATLTAGALAGCGQKVDNTASENNDATKEVQEESKAEDANDATQDSTEVTTIYAATGGSPKPFTFVDDSNELTGHNIELIKAVFDKLPQYKLEIEVTDFPSIFAGLDSDRYQIGVNNFAMNEERKEKYLFSDPIFANQYVAIFAKDSDKAESVETWDDLAGLKTISQAGINITTT